MSLILILGADWDDASNILNRDLKLSTNRSPTTRKLRAKQKLGKGQES